MSTPIDSPCKGVCAVNPVAGQCIGCFRTVAEISAWVEFDDAERARVTAELEQREAAFWAQMDESDD